MDSNLPTIPPFETGASPEEAWRHWRQDFEDYVEALRYGKEPEKTKTALFRHVCGDELQKQFRSFGLKPEGTLQQILDEFDNFFKDYQNEIYVSFKFLEMKQSREDKFSDYYSRLKSAVTEFNYGNLSDRVICDKIVQGLLDKPLQERLIRETARKAKALQVVVSYCKAAEHSKRTSPGNEW
ncbi:hypothetical protein AVEN_39880-1 [Araneus ventricosus]|uniref:Retrotransposon gag domain-containing protein n=1 Tax=Araneus ventricosus TaxID=182803 RepID=A0A4Y2PWC6_ARAVE|nr:hypothetical protein AVEN_39880-1 [Araneus ventricosus]